MEDIIEKNKVFAEFIQWSKDSYGVYAKPFNCMIPDDPMEYRSSMRYLPVDMLFHKSWDWIMPVVEKIESISVKGKEETTTGKRKVDWTFNIEIKDKQAMVHRYCTPQYYGEESDFLKLYDCRNTSKIEAVYNACYRFILWYNTQPKP